MVFIYRPEQRKYVTKAMYESCTAAFTAYFRYTGLRNRIERFLNCFFHAVNRSFMHVLLTKNGGRLLHHHSTKIIYLLVFPVATCQGCIHHYPSLFLDFPCFPYSKPWRMTRFSLSSTLWVLIEEKCISTKQVVLSIFFCKQGVNRSVVLVWMFSLSIPPFEHNKKGLSQ